MSQLYRPLPQAYFKQQFYYRSSQLNPKLTKQIFVIDLLSKAFFNIYKRKSNKRKSIPSRLIDKTASVYESCHCLIISLFFLLRYKLSFVRYYAVGIYNLWSIQEVTLFWNFNKVLLKSENLSELSMIFWTKKQKNRNKALRKTITSDVIKHDII